MTAFERPEFIINMGGSYPLRLAPSFNAIYTDHLRNKAAVSRDTVTLLFSQTGVGAIDLKAEVVKARIRRIRPQEIERLDAIDAEIERLTGERQSLIREAWTKAHVVTVAEVRAKADAALNRRKARA